MTPDKPGWRPIAEAPHAVDVLLFIPATDHTPARQEVKFASGGERYSNGYSSRWSHGSATHWMPLPPAPDSADG